MRILDSHRVRLDDSTIWAVDRDTDGYGTSLEWRQRYGSAADREYDRLKVASVHRTVKALLGSTQKRSSQVLRELRNALEEWDRSVDRE